MNQCRGELTFLSKRVETKKPQSMSQIFASKWIFQQRQPQFGHNQQKGGTMMQQAKVPMDILKLYSTPHEREEAFRNMAKEFHKKEPMFLKKQSRRTAKVEYNHKENCLYWGEALIPGGSGWKSTENFDSSSQRLGRIVLVLMVKNEAEILPRLLHSLVHEIDGFVILDTGSSDQTKEILWNTLVLQHHKKGHIFVAPWFDFGANRTILLHLAHQQGEWLLLCDADYRLVASNPKWKSFLPVKEHAPLQLLLCTTGDNQYYRPHIVQGDVLWSYACRTHEYLTDSPLNVKVTSSSFHHQNFPHLKIDHIGDGRSKNDKFPRDVVFLLMDLMDNPEDNRSFYYLGNTLSNMGNMHEWMLRVYDQHRYYRGWFEEQNSAFIKIIEAHFYLQHPPVEILDSVMDSILNTPDRLEPITLFLNYRHRLPREWSYILMSISALLIYNQYPEHHSLFIDKPTHDWVFWQRNFEIWTESPAMQQKIYMALGILAFQQMSKHVRELIQASKHKKKKPPITSLNNKEEKKDDKHEEQEDHDQEENEDYWYQCTDEVKVKTLLSCKQRLIATLNDIFAESRLNNLALMRVMYDYGLALESNQQYELAEEYFLAVLSPCVSFQLISSMPIKIQKLPEVQTLSEKVFYHAIHPQERDHKDPRDQKYPQAFRILGEMLPDIVSRNKKLNLELILKILREDPLTLWKGARRHGGVPKFLEILAGSFTLDLNPLDSQALHKIKNHSDYLDIQARVCCRLVDLKLKQAWVDSQHERSISSASLAKETNKEMAGFIYLLDALKIHPKHPLVVNQIRKYQSGLPFFQRNILDKWIRLTHFSNISGGQIIHLGGPRISKPTEIATTSKTSFVGTPSVGTPTPTSVVGNTPGMGAIAYAVSLPGELVPAPPHSLNKFKSYHPSPRRVQQRIAQLLKMK